MGLCQELYLRRFHYLKFVMIAGDVVDVYVVVAIVGDRGSVGLVPEIVLKS